MLNKLFSIAKNTFKETIRQPVYAIIIIAGTFIFFMSPSITMYSMDDDNKFLRELGLSTLFLAGLFISVFSAAAAITEEIETKTIITTLSKPIPRYLFILGKFLGVIAAVFLAHYIFTISHLMTLRHGVMTTASDSNDFTVITAAAAIVLSSVLISAFLNYSYDWKFTSTAISIAAIGCTIAMVFLAFIDSYWKFNPAENKIELFDIYASALLLIALLVLAALALMFSARFNVLITLSCCVGVFLLGLVSDYAFGRFADTQIWAKIGRALVPNLQVFWISDAIYEETQIPIQYIVMAGGYGLLYAGGILFLTIALFQKRQVG